MHSFLNDCRYAFRQASKAPLFASATILLIAAGIAVNAMVFTLVDALLLRRLPAPNPAELVRIIQHRPPLPDASDFEQGYWRLLAEQSTSFSTVIGKAEAEVPMTVDEQSDSVRVELVSSNYFAQLGGRADLGQLPASPDSVVLSNRFWHSRFDADPAIIGKTIRLNGQPFQVSGVTASEFHGITADLNPDMRVLTAASALFGRESERTYELVARLKPGISIGRARGETVALAERWSQEQARQHPGREAVDEGGSNFIQLESIEFGTSLLRGEFAGALALLMGGAALVLLLVSSNVAGLLLVRASGRSREAAVRLAMGATRKGLVAQCLTETLLVAFIGGALGVALAWLSRLGLTSLIPPLRNRAGELLSLDPSFGWNWNVAIFAFLASVSCAVLAGLAPAWHAWSEDLSNWLRSSRGGSRPISSARFEAGITFLQIAFCTLLVTEAALFARTVQRMRAMDTGFDAQHILTFTLRDPPPPSVTSPIWEQLRLEASHLPGVRSAALGWRGLLRGTGIKVTVGLPGSRPSEAEFLNSSLNNVSSEYFETMAMRVVAGRGFESTDRGQNGMLPAIVNQTFARKFFPGIDPVGKVFGRSTGSEPVRPTEFIVGVVTDSQYRSLREPVPPVYFHFDPDHGPILHIRTVGDPSGLVGPVRELVHKTAKGWSIREINLLRDERERSMWRERFVAKLLIGFAIAAGLLAAVGLYGTLAYYVSRSGRSIGIRLAIGAAKTDVIAMLARRTGPLVVKGVVVGLFGSYILSGWVRPLLFAMEPWDPPSIFIALSLIASVVACACLLPAMRAIRVDPAVTLRED